MITEYKSSYARCPRCGQYKVGFRVWQSSDGSREETRYKCFADDCDAEWSDNQGNVEA